jgi:hypothetical protein
MASTPPTFWSGWVTALCLFSALIRNLRQFRLSFGLYDLPSLPQLRLIVLDGLSQSPPILQLISFIFWANCLTLDYVMSLPPLIALPIETYTWILTCHRLANVTADITKKEEPPLGS